MSRDSGDAGSMGASGRRPKRLERTDAPESIGTVLGHLRGTRPLAAGIALGELGRRWADVVGDRLAGETAPIRLENGVLVVVASSAAWATQVRFLAGEVRSAANRVLSGAPVLHVKVALRPGAE